MDDPLFLVSSFLYYAWEVASIFDTFQRFTVTWNAAPTYKPHKSWDVCLCLVSPSTTGKLPCQWQVLYYYYYFIYFIWLYWVLVVACGI